MTDPARPTTIRHRIIGVTMLMAFILYLDRICMGEIVKSMSFNNDLALSQEQIGRILSAFFFTYALFQVPAGWASDRFGARPMLTLYIVLRAREAADETMMIALPPMRPVRGLK